ncbi:MAG TPA: adenine phosphoribosyltransferase [Alphaproteobacteria bacterium]
MSTLKDLEALIATTPDFPTPGVLFRDISPLLATRFADVVTEMGKLFTTDELANTNAFAGVDARGFVFASALAAAHNKNMVMIRKGGKLPPPSIQQTCTLEYGTAILELKPGPGGNVILLDDVLATGGTLSAAANLCDKAGYKVTAIATLIDLKFLNDFTWNGLVCRSLFQYT